jgi:hypothetical protein
VRLNKRSSAVQSGIGLHKEGDGGGVEERIGKTEGAETVRAILRRRRVDGNREGKTKMA